MPDSDPSLVLRPWVGAMVDTIRLVNSGAHLSAVLDHIAAQVCALLPFDMCAAMLPDPAESRLVVHGQAGLDGVYVERLNTDRPLVLHTAHTDDDSPAVRAYLTATIVAVPEVVAAVGFGPWRELAQRQGYRSLVAAPLRDGDGTLGVLVAYTRDAYELTGADRQLVELFAEQAATAIVTERLRTTQRSMIDRLSAANTELDDQRVVLEQAEDQHRRLMEVAVSDVGVAGVVAAIAEALHGTVTLESTDGAVLAGAGAGAGTIDPAAAAVPSAAQRSTDPLRTVLSELEASRRVVTVSGGLDPASAWYLVPVVVGSTVSALLWITGLTEVPGQVQQRGMERFGLVVALELLKQRNAVEVELRLTRDLLSDVLNGNPTRDASGWLARARAAGHDLALPHTVLLARADAAAGLAESPRIGFRLAAAVHGALRFDHPGTLVGAQGSRVVILVPHATPSPDVAGVAASILRVVNATLSPGTGSVLIGSVVTEISGYARAYRMVRGAADLMGSEKRSGVMDLSQLGIYGLLLGSQDPADLRDFSARLLDPLRAADERRHGDLLPTLAVWLDSDCSTARTAGTLHVHPNTVLYRLGQVEKLLDASLRSPDFLIQIQLALAVARVTETADVQ